MEGDDLHGKDTQFRGHVDRLKLKITGGKVFQGMIHLEGQSIADFSDLKFEGNHAYHRALIYANEDSYFNIFGSLFLDNSATDDSAVLHIEGKS